MLDSKRVGDFTLPNGLKTIYHIDQSNPVLCLQLYIRIGSAWESSEEAGYSHFLEHLVFKSTRDFLTNQIGGYISGMGGAINAYTDFDCTCFYVLIPSEYLEQGLHVLSELAVNSTFNKNDVKLEKEIVIEEQNQTAYDPELDLVEYIQRMSFTESTLRNPVLGTPKAIRSITFEKIQRFYKSYYQPSNAFLVITGDACPDSITNLVTRYFGKWENNSSTFTQCHNLKNELEKPRQLQYLRKNDHLLVAYVLPELSEAHPDSDALHIAMRYLAYGQASRLHKRLIDDEQLCSVIKVNSISGVFHGVSAVCIYPLDAKYVSKICGIVKQEIQSMVGGELDLTEIELVKKDILFSWQYGFDGVEDIANMLGAEEFIGNYNDIYVYDKLITKITASDVARVIKKYWSNDFVSVFVQAPDKVNIAETNLTGVTRQRESHASTTQHIPNPVNSDSNQSLDFIEVASGLFSSRLPNGMSLLYRRVSGKLVSGFSLSTELSRLSENHDQLGINFLTSAASLHSTQLHDHHELLSICRKHGFNIGIEHHNDSTIWSGKCVLSELPYALALLNEVLFHPRFEKHNIRVLKLSTIDSLRREKINPASEAYQRWFRMLVGPKSGYDRYTGGIGDIRNISASDITKWHNERYHPSMFSLAIVGSEKPDRVLNIANAVFNEHRNTVATMVKPQPRITPSKAKFHTKKSNLDQAIVHIGGFAVPAKERELTTAFYSLAHILGGDMDSRMFRILREEHGLTYQTGFDYTSTNDFGYWNAYAYCDFADRNKCLLLMKDILDDVRINGVTEAELADAQNYLCGMYRFEQENVAIHSAMLANLDSLGYEPAYYLNREQRLRSVSKDEIRAIAQKWLAPDNQYIHIYS